MEPYLDDEFISKLHGSLQAKARELNRRVVERAEAIRRRGLDVEEILIQATVLFAGFQNAAGKPADPNDELKEWSVVVAACLHALPPREQLSARQQRWAAGIQRASTELMVTDIREAFQRQKEAN